MTQETDAGESVKISIFASKNVYLCCTDDLICRIPFKDKDQLRFQKLMIRQHVY
jgi:hypothetical protein